MSVDRVEFVVAAGQYVGDGGYMKICAGNLEWRGVLVAGREYAGSQGSELEGLFGDNAIRCQLVTCDHWKYKLKRQGM